MKARRPTPSADPEPEIPLFMSLIRGVLESNSCINCGPLAPNLASTNAPPIQSKNGPKTVINPSRIALLIML